MVNGEVYDGVSSPQAKSSHPQHDRNSWKNRPVIRRADIVRIGVWLDDSGNFWSFNKSLRSIVGDHPPARACLQSAMVIDCKKVEVDLHCLPQDKLEFLQS